MNLLQSITEDIRFAFRMMRRSLGFTAVAILSLALGIGATIAIFSVIYALALKPLPVSQPDRLVEVEGHLQGNLHNYAEWKVFRDRQDIFSSVLAYNWSDAYFQIADPKGQQQVTGVYVSGDYFSTLGASAVLGRVLQSSDDQSGAPPVCVIGYGLWRRLYGQSRDVLGRAIRVNGNEFVIVGVAPKSFFGVAIGGIPEIFMPMEAQRTYNDYPILYGRQMPSLDNPKALKVSIVARLKPGMSLSKANAGLQVLSPEIYKAAPRLSDASGRPVGPVRLVARPITSDTWLQVKDIVLLLMTMAAVALIIACANLGNLLLARAAKRREEIATRLALGASRWRLVRQLLTESALLSVAGAAMGLILARWGSQLLLWALSFPDDPVRLDLSWDAKLAAFAVSVTLLCALLFGLSPAIRSTRISIYSAMNNGVTTGKLRNRFSNSLLVVVQVALSVVVLVSAGLLARTLQAFLTADLGYDPKGVLTAQATLHGSGLDPQRDAFVGEELLTAFRSLPGVTSASWGRISSSTMLSQLVVAGPSGSERRSGSYLNFVSPDFFSTRRTPMLAGRDFNAGDTGASPPVAVLSEALAKALFGGVNPIGLRFRENDGNANGRDYLVEVVGVARDIQYRRPDLGPLTILYRPVSQCGSSCSGFGGYEIRTAGSVAQAAKRLESAAAAVDSRVSLKLGLLSNAMDGVLHRNRAMALIATAFGLFVALLAMIGVYGVTSYTTAERTREIGIRMSLGAQPANVLRMVLGETMRVVCVGFAFGVAVGVAAARSIQALLFGVTPADPLSFGFAICLMLAIAGIAAFLPARRAMRVDPVVALRFE
ncbi:MAG TPA: ABC transporter permease [Candidatus Acidoferrum sp.]|jgi:predicted permease